MDGIDGWDRWIERMLGFMSLHVYTQRERV